MGDSYNAVSCVDSGLHDVHVLPTDGVVQAEGLSMVGRDLQRWELCHGASSLMRHIVDDKYTPGICHFAVLPVVCLHVNSSVKRLGCRGRARGRAWARAGASCGRWVCGECDIDWWGFPAGELSTHKLTIISYI